MNDQGTRIEAEDLVLGVVLEHPGRWADVGLHWTMFSSANKATARAISEMTDRDLPIDPLTVSDFMAAAGWSGKGVELVGKLVKLSQFATTQSNVEYYAEIIREHYLTEQIQFAAAEVSTLVSKGIRGEELAAKLSEAIERACEAAGGKELVTLGSGAQEEIKAVQRDWEALSRGEVINTGIPLGMGMNKLIPGGIPIGLVALLAGDTGAGKSTVVREMVAAAAQEGHGCIVFSLEDPAQLYVQRSLAASLDIPSVDLITRERLSESHRRLLHGAGEGNTPDWMDRVLIDDRAGLRMSDVAREVARMKRQLHLEPGKGVLVVVDYLQILASEGNLSTNDSLKETLKIAQKLAKREKVALLFVSQFNTEYERDAKDNNDPRPRMSYIYGAKTAAMFCKTIIALHRPAKYCRSPIKGRHYFPQEEEVPPTPEQWERTIEFWVLKNIRGPEDRYVTVDWTPETGRMEGR
jgi:replicative DNA helicase